MFSISRNSNNGGISTAIASITQQVQELSHGSASSAKRFSEASKQMCGFVLPDAMLAVREGESSMASSLLTVAEDNISELRLRGEAMQHQHEQLQQRVQSLIDSTHSIDLLPMNLDKQAASPRSVRTSSTEYESSTPGDQSSDDGYQSSDDEYQPSSDSKFIEHELDMNPRASHPHQSDCNAHSSPPLTELEVLKKEEVAIEFHLAFWLAINAAVQKLTQMKHHTACLVQFGSKNARLCARAEQRLDEYASVWASLEPLCQQYLVGQEMSSIPLAKIFCHDGASDLSDAAPAVAHGPTCHLQCPAPRTVR